MSTLKWESPSRLFLVPTVSQLEKIYPILTCLNYEVIERQAGNSTFFLTVQRKHGPKDFLNSITHSFEEISLSIQGHLQSDQKWQVRIQFQSKQAPNPKTTRSAHLVLENITLVLGWQNFWIIECPPPSVRPAA